MTRVLLSAPLCPYSRLSSRFTCWPEIWIVPYNIYHFTEAAYDHRTVNHGAGEYARRDPDGTCVHCNTMEGIWSGLRNFLDHFRGISQRFLHLRVARYEFLHNHGHLPWHQTFEVALRRLFSTTGDYWRWMAHQHRRMPLTLCYR